MKLKIRKTDTMFSKYIRSRDGWICQRCRHKHEVGSRGLHCSHYWSRGNESTRQDPNNCISLCYACHMLWGHGDERDDYKDFMIKKLGKKGFNDLKVKAAGTKKRDDILDEIVIKNLLAELNNKNPMNPKVKEIVNKELYKFKAQKQKLERELKKVNQSIKEIEEDLK